MYAFVSGVGNGNAFVSDRHCRDGAEIEPERAVQQSGALPVGGRGEAVCGQHFLEICREGMGIVMQNSFFQAICRIGIFMICVRAVIHFRPNESYEKYLRLLAGILIMIQLFLPVGRLLLGKGGQEAAQVLQQFRQELERGMEEAAESAATADALLEQMTLEEIQRRMEEQASREDGEENSEDREENMENGEENPEGAEKGGEGIDVRVEEIEPISIGSLPSETE